MPNWVDIVLVVLEKDMFKSRNFAIISLLQKSMVLHLHTHPIGIFCVKFGWNCLSGSSMWKVYDNEIKQQPQETEFLNP